MGAALATLITLGLAAAFGLAVFLHGRHGIELDWRDFKPDMVYIRRSFLPGITLSIATYNSMVDLQVAEKQYPAEP